MTTERKRLCAWCGEPVRRKSLNGPVPTYCKAGCKQRAYEQRRIDQAEARAWGESLLAAGGSLGPNPSRDGSEPRPDPSRDGSPGAVPPAEAPPTPSPLPRPGRRRVSMTADPMPTLPFPPEEQ